MLILTMVSESEPPRSTPYVAVVMAAVLLTTAIVVPLTILITNCKLLSESSKPVGLCMCLLKSEEQKRHKLTS